MTECLRVYRCAAQNMFAPELLGVISSADVSQKIHVPSLESSQ